MEKITSRTNDKIKYAVRLGESTSLRKETGEFFLEGDGFVLMLHRRVSK